MKVPEVNPLQLHAKLIFPFLPFCIHWMLHRIYLMNKQRRAQLIPQGLIPKFLFRQNSSDVNESFHHVRISVVDPVRLNTILPKILFNKIIVISCTRSFDYKQGAELCQFNCIIVPNNLWTCTLYACLTVVPNWLPKCVCL